MNLKKLTMFERLLKKLNMKKGIRYFIWSCSALLLSSPVMLLAQTDNYGLEGTAEGSGLKKAGETATPLPELIGNIIKGALSLLGVVFFILIVYGGYKWMIARGNSTEVDKAKDTIVNATIGLIIVMAAYAISIFVVSRLESATGLGGKK